MQPEQRTCASSGKMLPTGTAVQQVTLFVLAVFTANANVVMPEQAIVFALFVGGRSIAQVRSLVASGAKVDLPGQPYYKHESFAYEMVTSSIFYEK